MKVDEMDLSILEKLNFNTRPVAVKFLTKEPDYVARLDEKMALCEMLKRSQEGGAFFTGAEHHQCEAGLYVLGLGDISEPYLNGEFGAGLKIFNGTRAASRLYHHIPKIEKGVIKYLAFSPLENLGFEPDLLIIISNPSQTEILLRAMSYETGKMWVSKFTPAIGCAWTYVYPYLTGELNYSVTGLGHGMKRRKLFAEGQQIVSIPFDLLPGIIKSLHDMPWVLPAYEPDGMEYVANLIDKLGLPKPT